MPTILIKVNKHIDGYKPGDVEKVITDQHGIPLQQSWRRRLDDAETDQCCEIVEPEKPVPLTKTEKPKRTSKNKHQETE